MTTTRTNAITSEDVARSDKFRDEPALSAFSDGYVATLGDVPTGWDNFEMDWEAHA